MVSRHQARSLSFALLFLFGVSACSQEESTNSDLVQAEAYLDVAELYLSQGQFRAAVIEVQNALQGAPGYSDARRLGARLDIELGSHASAQAVLEQILSQAPGDAESTLLLAESYLTTGDQNRALELLNSLNTDDTEQSVQKLWLSANIQVRNNNEAAAYESLQSALQLNPSHIKSLVTLSMLEFQGGNEFGAQDYLEQAGAIDPADLDLLLWQGQFALLRENYLESEEAYAQALQIMGVYDIMTPKRLSALRAIIVPLQMQQKNEQAMQYSQIIAETPQGQLQNSFDDAVSMLQEGNIAEAESLINEVLAMAPDHAGSNILMGMVQYAQGDFQGAEQSLSGLVSADTSSPEMIKVLAASHLRLNQPERALSVLEGAFASYPEDGSLLAMMAISQQSMGEIDLSIETFNRALELQTDSPDLHFALASSYSMIEDNESAVEQLNLALELNSDYTQAKVALVDLYLGQDQADIAMAKAREWVEQDADSVINNNLAGRVASRQANSEQARQYYEASLEIDSTNVDAHLFLAAIDVEAESYANAEAHILEVLEGQPQNIAALSGLLSLGDLSQSQSEQIGRVQDIIEEQQTEFAPPLVLAQYYLSKNNAEDARSNAQLAYARNENPFTENVLMTVLLGQAGLEVQQQDFSAARETVNYALEVQPENMQAMIVAAGIETQDGEYAAARAHLERVKELRPEGTTIGMEAEGDFFFLQEDFEPALNSYREAWDLAATPALGMKLHRTLGTLERTAQASEFLQEWDALVPGDPTANMMLGMDYQGQSRDDLAIERYETAIEQQPNNAVVLNNLAWLYQDSNPTRAVELSTRAAELFSENADVLDTHGWILYKIGRQQEAVEVLERALELAPDSQSIADHLETARQ